MKKYLTALMFLAMGVLPANAQETVLEEETNVFGYPDKSFVKVIEQGFVSAFAPVNPKPDCENQRLKELTRKTLEPYIVSPKQTIVQKRRSQLTLKNIDHFVPFDANVISPDIYPELAGRLVELKINNRLSDENFKICLNDNPALETEIYLLMYDDEDRVRVDIINFSDLNIPSFVFDDN